MLLADQCCQFEIKTFAHSRRRVSTPPLGRNPPSGFPGSKVFCWLKTRLLGVWKTANQTNDKKESEEEERHQQPRDNSTASCKVFVRKQDQRVDTPQQDKTENELFVALLLFQL